MTPDKTHQIIIWPYLITCSAEIITKCLFNKRLYFIFFHPSLDKNIAEAIACAPLIPSG